MSSQIIRPNWHRYFMDFASHASVRGTCPRLQVGAILVDKDHGIISTGYNGSPRGIPSCDEVGCLEINGRCERSIHAEINALIQALRNGASTIGSTIYVTHRPCYRCTIQLIQSGVREIIYEEDYKSDNENHVMEILWSARVPLWRLYIETLIPANTISDRPS